LTAGAGYAKIRDANDQETPMKTRSRNAAVLSSMALLALAGCSSADSFRSNPTPEMATLSHTNDEALNRMTIMSDTNLSAIQEDAARFLLIDRPSILMRPRTPY